MGLVGHDDDWRVFVRFYGLKTGKLLEKNVGVSSNADRDRAVRVALSHLKIRDRSRVVEIDIRRIADWRKVWIPSDSGIISSQS